MGSRTRNINRHPRFLQSSRSNLIINEQDALREHGMATFACLLSGLEVFGETYEEHHRYLRVAKGIHGFHIYATEHWTEYLLSHAVSEGGVNISSPFVTLACLLANKLDETILQESPVEIDSELSVSDQRLTLLGQHPVLCKQVEAALRGRSLKRLENELVHHRGKSHI